MTQVAAEEGRLVSIHIGGAEWPLSSVEEVRAVAGRGLEGDRYFAARGTWSSPGLWSEVTLIESETVDFVRSSTGFEGNAGMLRRNLVTRGIVLEGLIGSHFHVGEVVLEGVRPCDPCGYLERLVEHPGLKDALAGRGGLRARIVKEGIIRTGAPIRIGEPGMRV